MTDQRSLSGSPAPSATALGFRQTIDRRLVHRAAIAEVLVTDVVRTGAARFQLGVQWPRAHTFYGVDAAGRHDPMLIAETIRQAGLLLSHLGYGLPAGYQFVFLDLDFAVADAASLHVAGTPTDLAVTVECTDVRERRGVLRSMRVNLALRREGELAAEGSGAVACVEPQRYPALRWRGAPPRPDAPPAAPPPSVPPAGVDRDDERDVVLGSFGDEPPGWWSVRVLTDHPVLFDHPLDHIPGMLQLEAFRQAALLAERRPQDAPPPLLSALRIECLRYADLDRIAVCRAEPKDGGAYAMRLCQDGEDVAVGEVTLRR